MEKIFVSVVKVLGDFLFGVKVCPIYAVISDVCE